MQFESEFISVKYKAWAKIHTLHFSVQLWPLPVERTGRPPSSSHFDTCLCTLVCDTCVSMTCMLQRLCWGQRTTCKDWPSLPPSGGWGLNSDCSPWRQVSVPAEPSQGPNCTCSLVISVCLGLLMFTTADCSVEHRKGSWEYLRVRGSVNAIIFATGILLLECMCVCV